MNKIRSPLIRKAARLDSFSQQFGRYFAVGVDEPKLTKSDDVKYHSVHHYAVEKTPITAQLWMQRTKVRESIAGATSLSAISPVSKDTTQINDSAPTFLLDKTAKESRLTIRYKFSEDGKLQQTNLTHQTDTTKAILTYLQKQFTVPPFFEDTYLKKRTQFLFLLQQLCAIYTSMLLVIF